MLKKSHLLSRLVGSQENPLEFCWVKVPRQSVPETLEGKVIAIRVTLELRVGLDKGILEDFAIFVTDKFVGLSRKFVEFAEATFNGIWEFFYFMGHFSITSLLYLSPHSLVGEGFSVLANLLLSLEYSSMKSGWIVPAHAHFIN